MKKLICVAMCLLLVIPCAFAEELPRRMAETEPAYSWLHEETMALAERFQRGLNSTDHTYVLSSTLTVPWEDMEEELRLIQTQDFTQPLDVSFFRADQLLSDQVLGEMIKMGIGEKALLFGDESDLIRELYLASGTYLNQQTSPAFNAISDAIRVRSASVCPEELDSPCCAVLNYGGLYALLVTFYPAEEREISASAQLIYARTADDLNLPTE